jgi:hypothetical protein
VKCLLLAVHPLLFQHFVVLLVFMQLEGKGLETLVFFYSLYGNCCFVNVRQGVVIHADSASFWEDVW